MFLESQVFPLPFFTALFRFYAFQRVMETPLLNEFCLSGFEEDKMAFFMNQSRSWSGEANTHATRLRGMCFSQGSVWAWNNLFNKSN